MSIVNLHTLNESSCLNCLGGKDIWSKLVHWAQGRLNCKSKLKPLSKNIPNKKLNSRTTSVPQLLQ